jgi:hypothetical protein
MMRAQEFREFILEMLLETIEDVGVDLLPGVSHDEAVAAAIGSMVTGVADELGLDPLQASSHGQAIILMYKQHQKDN